MDTSTDTPSDTFEQELERLINRFSQENLSDTPDFILAEYLVMCLAAWNQGVTRREQWYGRKQQVLTAWHDGVPSDPTDPVP